MTTTRNEQDLAQRVMEILGMLEAQSELPAEEAALIKRVYATRYEEWFFRKIAFWPIDEIPAAAFESLAEMMTEAIAPSFGSSVPVIMDENGQQIAVSVRGLRNMRRIIQIEASGLPTTSNYF
jgi:hypothetical protein